MRDVRFLGGRSLEDAEEPQAAAPAVESLMWNETKVEKVEAITNMIYIKVGRCASLQAASHVKSLLMAHYASRNSTYVPKSVPLASPCRPNLEYHTKHKTLELYRVYHNQHTQRRFIDFSLNLEKNFVGRTFLWSVVRAPLNRCRSHMYFHEHLRASSSPDEKIAWAQTCSEYMRGSPASDV